MQFRVPQFINIEDKILGPLGWKQLGYVIAGVGVTYLTFKALDSKVIATIVSAPAIALFAALAFVKINNKDFLSVMEDAVKFYLGSKVYTWQKDNRVEQASGVNNSKLDDKALEIDTKKNQ